MERLSVLSAALVLTLLPAAALAKPPMKHPAAPPAAHVMLQPAQMHWGDGPSSLPKGAKSVVLFGDPGAHGPFVMRIKAPAGYRVGMHWHPTGEQVTVIEGDFTVSSDDGTPAQRLGAGGFASMPARMHHAASTEAGTTVQVSGMGPFEITYVDPNDDPRKATKAK